MADVDSGGSKTPRTRKRGRPAVDSTPLRKQKKKEKYQSRVYLGDSYKDWSKLRQELNVKDRVLARKLLDSYEKHNKSAPRTSSPKRATLPVPSFFADESSVGIHDPADDRSASGFIVENMCLSPPHQILEGAVNRSPPRDMEEGALNSISCLQPRNPVNESEVGAPNCRSDVYPRDPENETEINALENIQLSVELDVCEAEDEDEDDLCYDDDVENDPDYIPPAALRSSSKLLGKDIEEYEVITAEQEVFCHDMAPGMGDTLLGEESSATEEEASFEESDVDKRFPRELKILHPNDIVYEKCAITYNRNIVQLVGFLELPADKQKCRVPDCSSSGPPEPAVEFVASGIVVKWHCSGGHLVWRWFSQPRLKYGLQGGDFMQAANILLSGNNFGKYSLMCKFMNMGCVNESTFHKIQAQYCVNTIDDYWREKLQGIIQTLRNKDEVVLLGDGRMDSPGYCAQYCTYTAIDNDTRAIVALEVVDKRETDKKSTVMEKEGFKRAMTSLLDQGVKVTEVCTDAHPQISALMNPDKGVYGTKGIHHSLDVWHGAKNLTKKIVAAGQEKSCTDLKQWTRDVVNHFWWCCKKAKTYEEFSALWRGVLHHVCDEHKWGTGSCQHEPIVSSEARTKSWLVPGSTAHKKLGDVLLKKRWLKTTSKYLRFRTTSDLESFQNHILMYCSKRHSFSPPVYKARCQLAALDYNHHRDRPVWKTKEGRINYKRRFQKKSERWSIFVPKQPKKYEYIRELQAAIVNKRIQSGCGMSRTQPMSESDPRRTGNLARLPPPPISELVEKHVSRMEGATQDTE
ncbi:Hypp7037 [Branchiostoma lanceolatum]|uniref:Hypp7037 protein n=2 Tax=Branchiostoma lanceolatum TaxID=7740 RepID=A0A8J9YWN8_BRALA|nr:Hypp7037 [Branchiostoma lanceolatum]